MQTDVPTLPVVYLNTQKNPNRKENLDLKSVPEEANASSLLKNTSFSHNKKCLHPLPGGPYKNNVKQYSSREHSKGKNTVAQRVLSAKMLQFKQLQNQLADAHYHLNELSNENRLLKALQKRQDSALKHYEGANAELPRIINSHNEELRVLQAKYKKLKVVYKETCEQLKERESEVQCLQTQNKHLLQLSKDRNLQEREKLQLQVSDLNHRIQQQQETIQGLHRKLMLESKCLKHQLQTEVARRKEVQKNLQETEDKLKKLEHFLGYKEKRLCYTEQLPTTDRDICGGTRSLTNLMDFSVPNVSKSSVQNQKWRKSALEHNSRLLGTTEETKGKKEKVETTIERTQNLTLNSFKTETMESLEQIRKYRLQKPSRTYSTHSLDSFEQEEREVEEEEVNEEDDEEKEVSHNTNENSILQLNIVRSESSGTTKTEGSPRRHETQTSTYKKLHESRNYNILEIATDFNNPDSGNEHAEYFFLNVPKMSRALHARLVNSEVGTFNEVENIIDGKDRERYWENKSETLSNEPKYYFDNYNDELRNDIESKPLDEISPECSAEIELQSSSNYGIEKNNDDTNKSSLARSSRKSHRSPKSGEEKSDNSNILETASKTANIIASENVSNKSSREENFTIQDNKEIDINSEKKIDIVNDINTSIQLIDKFSAISLLENSSRTQLPETEKNNDFTQNGTDLEHEESRSTNSYTKQLKLRNELMVVEPKYSLSDDEILRRDSEKADGFDTNESNGNKRRHSNGADRNRKELNRRSYPNTVNTHNSINRQDIIEVESVKTLPSNSQSANQASVKHPDVLEEVNTKQKISNKGKTVNYDKEKLLATIRAIDNNENIEFVNNEYKQHSLVDRKQITENLYRGIPTQSKTKHDIIKSIFSKNTLENKPRNAYSKLL